MKNKGLDLNERDLVIDKEKPYLRPFICKGDYKTAEAMLIGINPASPIYPKDICIDDYTALCADYNSFMEFYKKTRRNSGKKELSRTRTGIVSFVNWLNTNLHIDVIETDIFTYPTSSVKELSYVSKDILMRSRDLFWNSFLSSHQCSMAILYGSLTFKSFIELLTEKNIVCSVLYNSNGKTPSLGELAKYPIELLEENSPVLEVIISDKKIAVFAVRHLMYYGRTGESYDFVKTNILKFWKEV